LQMGQMVTDVFAGGKCAGIGHIQLFKINSEVSLVLGLPQASANQ
jgi:hypothetical protein